MITPSSPAAITRMPVAPRAMAEDRMLRARTAVTAAAKSFTGAGPCRARFQVGDQVRGGLDAG